MMLFPTHSDDENEQNPPNLDHQDSVPRLIPAQADGKKGKLCVVLDMDETLIHSDFVGCSRAEYKAQELASGRPPCDFFMDVCDGVAVYIRPGLSHFLKFLSSLCELVVFTAGEQEYADAVLNTVDPNGYISHRLYRDSTCDYRGLSFVKDLNHLNRDLSRCVLVDNNLLSMCANPDNCILIEDFINDKSDRELPLIASILVDLLESEDIRPILQECFPIRELVETRFFGRCPDNESEDKSDSQEECAGAEEEEEEYDDINPNARYSTSLTNNSSTTSNLFSISSASTLAMSGTSVDSLDLQTLSVSER